MALQFHPEKVGTVLICDFTNFVKPEMTKRRAVIVVTPKLPNRDGLCTVVPLSTTQPDRIWSYHHKIVWDDPLPRPYDSPFHWVKCDMLYTVAFCRLNLPHIGKDAEGKRIYIVRTIKDEDLRCIRACILRAMELSHLTDHL